jgi:hypothetical protein
LKGRDFNGVFIILPLSLGERDRVRGEVVFTYLFHPHPNPPLEGEGFFCFLPPPGES